MTLPPGLAGPRAVLVLDLYDDQLPTEQTRVLHRVVQPRQLLIPANILCPSIKYFAINFSEPGVTTGSRTATATDQPGTTPGATTARNATSKPTSNLPPASALQPPSHEASDGATTRSTSADTRTYVLLEYLFHSRASASAEMLNSVLMTVWMCSSVSDLLNFFFLVSSRLLFSASWNSM